MRDGDVSITQRHLPHWRLDGATYFLTFRLKSLAFSEDEIAIVRDHIRDGDGKFYELLAVMVMPDHVHVILRPNDGIDLSRIMKGMKGASARLINQWRQRTGPLWQDESWDRIIRNHDEYVGQVNYMFENPIRKGLIDDPWKWPGWWYREG
jgi:putative transposase